MALTYSASIQNRISIALFGVQYTDSAMDATKKVAIDGTWSSGALTTGAAFDALTVIQQIAVWFDMVGTTASPSAPAVWEHWLVAETVYRLSQIYRPERQTLYEAEKEKAIDLALDSYMLVGPTDAFSSASPSQTASVNGIKRFVMNHCARRKGGTNTGLRRRIFPPPDEIEAHIQWTLNYIYNKEQWNFRKREVALIITQIAYPTAATWTESSLTLTQTGAFASVPSTANLAGKTCKVRLASGTGVVLNEYRVVSKTSDDAVVLAQSIAIVPGNLATADIVGTMFVLEIRGTVSGESFDATASRKFYYSATSATNYVAFNALQWLDATDMDRQKTRYGTSSVSVYTGQPEFFRTEILPGDIYSWTLAPFPDASYQLTGSVFISGPGTPSSNVDTAVFAKFPGKFFTVIRDMVLARTLLFYDTSDSEKVWGRVVDQVGELLPEYTDQGAATKLGCATDVYQDAAQQWGSTGGPYSLGWNGGGTL